LVFTDKVPRLIRAASESDRVVSAISSSRRYQRGISGLRRLQLHYAIRAAWEAPPKCIN
jgi:hypothetical protein